MKWKISVRYESHFPVVLRQFSGFAGIFVKIIYMELIDLVYRFSGSAVAASFIILSGFRMK